MTYSRSPDEINDLHNRLKLEAEESGYNLNPDEEFTRDLAEALLTNTQRYGYQSCPCRLADGTRDKDLDIICPCDYRDPDLTEFGSCYCALYVSGEIARGEKEASPIPERRTPRNAQDGPREGERGRGKSSEGERGSMGAWEKELDYTVWRCSVCGYLCAREHPPEKCPICGADKDRFQKFL